MKVTDYAPRAAPFDNYLRYGRALVGAEIGVDVGAHAEALLRHCDIARLYLIDPWPKPYYRGYCEGRLSALGFRSRFELIEMSSRAAALNFINESLDFVYIDQEHDADVVRQDLEVWWPRVKPGGVLGYRNYSSTPTPLVQAVDAFVALHLRSCTNVQKETGEIVLVKPCASA